MILLDVQVPQVDKVYDFELDEEMTAGELTEKITVMIAQQELMEYDRANQMFLYAMDHGKILQESLSLKQQGVRGGERLVLL
jgi:uncharacterized ubiquitin-like protein YukD